MGSAVQVLGTVPQKPAAQVALLTQQEPVVPPLTRCPLAEQTEPEAVQGHVRFVLSPFGKLELGSTEQVAPTAPVALNVVQVLFATQV
jgi:hypothetical protein